MEQRSLAGSSSWSRKELDMTECLSMHILEYVCDIELYITYTSLKSRSIS